MSTTIFNPSFANPFVETLGAVPISGLPSPSPSTIFSGTAPVSACATIDIESLYAEFAPLVKQLMRKYSSDVERRTDLAGEVYCRFCDLVETFDPERGIPLRPYLVRHLTVSIYTYMRRRWILQKREAHLEEPESQDIPGPGSGGSAAWHIEISLQQILQGLPYAIVQLSERQRKIIYWRYYDALPFEEIAGMLHIRPSTVRSHLRHGLDSIRKQILFTKTVLT